jgi:hypothetical protein
MKLNTLAKPLILVDGTFSIGSQSLFECAATTHDGQPALAYIQDFNDNGVAEQAQAVGLTVSSISRVCKEVAEDFFEALPATDYTDIWKYWVDGEFERDVDIMEYAA